ncbi:TlpA disulfide reductase family protein [Mesorhizobium sp. M1374]|uniref:TlpA family protein disulfide reductase n=1 Tax=Mesorhizobium sp. M1374 TaxID=2957091 RepID=UPI00333E159F
MAATVNKVGGSATPEARHDPPPHVEKHTKPGATARPATAAEPPQNFAVQETPQPLPEIQFQDGDGQPQTLADFRGKVVLLNIWATWCAPCRKEMRHSTGCRPNSAGRTSRSSRCRWIAAARTR